MLGISDSSQNYNGPLVAFILLCGFVILVVAIVADRRNKRQEKYKYVCTRDHFDFSKMPSEEVSDG